VCTLETFIDYDPTSDDENRWTKRPQSDEHDLQAEVENAEREAKLVKERYRYRGLNIQSSEMPQRFLYPFINDPKLWRVKVKVSLGYSVATNS
jgi:hypothetical protein